MPGERPKRIRQFEEQQQSNRGETIFRIVEVDRDRAKQMVVGSREMRALGAYYFRGTAVMAGFPSLEEGGLVVRQVGRCARCSRSAVLDSD